MSFMLFLEEYRILNSISEDDVDSIIEDLDNEEALEEKLSLLARKKRSNLMKKLSKKLQKKKEQKLKKGPTKADIQSKARKDAIKIIKNKLTRGKTDLSPKEKERIEDRLSKLGNTITKIAKKQIKNVRDREKLRREQYKQSKQLKGNENGLV